MMRGFDACSSSRGITLIEVMVAFVILALSVTVLLRIFSSGLSNTVLSQQYVDAVVLAESKLSQIGATNVIQPGVETGSIDQKYAWKTSVDPYYPWLNNDEEILPVSAFIVNVEISWLEKGKQRNVNLRSIKLQNNSLTGGRG